MGQGERSEFDCTNLENFLYLHIFVLKEINVTKRIFDFAN